MTDTGRSWDALIRRASRRIERAVDDAAGFKDTEAVRAIEVWQRNEAEARARYLGAVARRTSRWVLVGFLLTLALLAWVLGAEAVAVGLLAASGVLTALTVTKPSPKPPAPTPRPAALPSVPRSSATYGPLTSVASQRSRLQALLPHTPGDISWAAAQTAAETETVVGELASAVRRLEVHQIGESTSAALARLAGDLRSASAAYADLVDVVDTAAAAGRETRTDEISARVAGIAAAVEALRPELA